MSHYEKAISQLEDAYYSILARPEFAKIYLDSSLSGVFLGCPDQEYFESKRKVLFVGQEPKTWRTKCPLKNGEDVTLPIIREAMSDTVRQSKLPAEKHKLIKFYKRCSLELSESQSVIDHSAVYSNQFCMSYNRKSPVTHPSFDLIEELSNCLLQAQFDILKPDVAIFTTGSNRDKHIKKLSYSTVEIIEPKRLWHFMVNNTNCFRINHPSARQPKKLGLSTYQNAAIERARLIVPISN